MEYSSLQPASQLRELTELTPPVGSK